MTQEATGGERECLECRELYSFSEDYEESICSVCASAQTEDRATAPSRIYVQVYPHERFVSLAAYELDPREIHDNGKPVYEYVRAERIEALEAALGRLAVDILQGHNDSALEFARTLTVTSASDCTPRAVPAALKGDSHEATN